MSTTDYQTDIHDWFSLSYSNYLVVEPEVLDAMSEAWRDEFGEMLTQFERAFAHQAQPDRYWAQRGQYRAFGDLTEGELARLGIQADPVAELADDASADEVDAWYTQRAERTFTYEGQTFYHDQELIIPEEADDDRIVAFRIVLPRTLLQSMPLHWQHRFVDLITQTAPVVKRLGGQSAYRVRAQHWAGGRWEDITDPVPHYGRGRTRVEPNLGAAGIDPDGDA